MEMLNSLYTHGLTNAQRTAIVDGEDSSHATAGSLRARFAELEENATVMNWIADNDITKFVIVDGMSEGEKGVQFVDFTNRSDDSDGFALIIPFENDPNILAGRVNMTRFSIEDYMDGLGGIPTSGVRTIWPLPGMTSAQWRREGVSHEKPVALVHTGVHYQ